MKQEHVTYCLQRDRREWNAKWHEERGRAVGLLYHGTKFIRKFAVSIRDGKFTTDIGTGSGVKITFEVGE